MTDDDDLDNMPWFHQLTMDERVHLLGRPHAQLPPGLAERLLNRPGVQQWWFTANPEETTHLSLAPQAAKRLDDQRAQLDYWWSCLTAEDQTYLIGHRDGELDAEYANIVHSAGETPLNEPPALRVAVVKDVNNAYRFSLPPMVRVYVEMKARLVSA
jgi:hypothetical protein